MTPADLRLACTILFGPRWQTALARLLKKPDGTHVNPRTVRRWASGKVPEPFWVGILAESELARRSSRRPRFQSS